MLGHMLSSLYSEFILAQKMHISLSKIYIYHCTSKFLVLFNANFDNSITITQIGT